MGRASQRQPHSGGHTGGHMVPLGDGHVVQAKGLSTKVGWMTVG